MKRKSVRRSARNIMPGYVETEKSPYPINSPYNGAYNQRVIFYGKGHSSIFQADLSLSMIDYWINRLQAARLELVSRMQRDIEGTQ